MPERDAAMGAPLLIVGAGGFGRSVADAVAAGSDWTVAGFIDDRGPDLGTVLGHPVLGRIADLARLRAEHGRLVVAVGDNARRFEICVQALAMGFELVNVIHPRASVSPHATLHGGVLVMAGAIVGTEAVLHRGAIVNAGAVVDHHAIVGEGGHLGVGACMGGGAVLAAGGWLREGAVLGAGRRLPPAADDGATTGGTIAR